MDKEYWFDPDLDFS